MGRFLCVDPLASEYPSYSDYAYVAGNPIIFIDPDGRNTIYYDEDGNELWRDDDELDNAVVVLANDDIAEFNNARGIEVESKDALNTILRTFGTNYMVDGMIELLEESMNTPAKKDRYYMKDGSTMWSEISASFVKNGNEISVDLSTAVTFNQPDYTKVNDIHSHPNGYIATGVIEIDRMTKGESESPDFGGPLGAPPSRDDQNGAETTNKDHRNVAISPSKIWFYNGSKNQNIGAPINFFK